MQSRSSDATFAPEFTRDGETVAVKRLPSGYFHLRGVGICNWAQPIRWPCSDDELLRGFFEEAGVSFRRAVEAENRALRGDDDGDD